MRPIQLEMVFFGPYKKAVINFDELDKAPLFLISGDTGAGKTTIFDAMTIALFDVSASGRESKEMRSNFASLDDVLTTVTFYFSLNDKIYKVKRELKQEIAKRGGGTREVPPTATLSIVEYVGGGDVQALASNKKNVDNEIKELLQLDADQFKQIILLPQNDFMKFLDSDSNDKKAILKKVFGTDIFENFKNALNVKFTSLNKQKSSIEGELSAHYISNVWTDEQISNFAELDDINKLEQAKTIVENYKKELEAVRVRYDDLKKQKEIAEKELADGQIIITTQQNLAKAEESYQTEIIDNEDLYKQNLNMQGQLNFASKIKEAYDKYIQYKNQVVDLQTQIDSEMIRLDGLKPQLQEAINKFDNHVKQDSGIKELSGHISLWTGLKEKAQSVEKFSNDLKTDQDKLDKLYSDLEKLTNKIAELEKDKVNANSKIISEEKLNLEYNQIGELKHFIDLIKERISNIETTNNSIIKANKDIEGFSAQIEGVKKQIVSLTSEETGLKKKQKEIMILQLQEELVEGEPCQVCGSTHHPFASGHGPVDNDELKNIIELLEQVALNITNANADLVGIETTIKNRKELIDKANSDIKEWNQSILEDYEELKGKHSDLELPVDYDKTKLEEFIKVSEEKHQQVKETNEANIEELKRIESDIEKQNKNKSENETEIASVSGRIEATNNSLAETKKDLTEELKTKDEYQQLITDANTKIKLYNDELESLRKDRDVKRQSVSAVETTIQTQSGNLATAKENQDTNKASIDAYLSSSDALTNSLDELVTWIGNLSQLSSVTTFISTYDANKVNYEKRINEFKNQLKDKQIPDITSLEENKAKLETQYDVENREFERIKNLKESTEKTVVQIEDIMNNQKEFLVEYKEVADLFNTISGKNNSKFDLETYVLQNYLNRVLDYANTRFMNNFFGSRYKFLIGDSRSTGIKNTGLDIDVLDMVAGKNRSIKTLSGGEKFTSALAIALSLSEVVQNTSNGAIMDALFIDEGFGTLDPETLNEAIEVLESIGENRMVGVISHVDAMKERIGQQLLIKKAGDGSSTIEMIERD